MKLAFGADHAAYELREALAAHARTQGHEVTTFGATGPEPYDYPDAADAVVREIYEKRADLGVLCCGTGIGITIRANRYEHIRAANCTSVEMAQLARQHNHANILGLGARILTIELATSIFDAFLSTPESTEPRHIARVEKIDAAHVC